MSLFFFVKIFFRFLLLFFEKSEPGWRERISDPSNAVNSISPEWESGKICISHL